MKSYTITGLKPIHMSSDRPSSSINGESVMVALIADATPAKVGRPASSYRHGSFGDIEDFGAGEMCVNEGGNVVPYLSAPPPYNPGPS